METFEWCAVAVRELRTGHLWQKIQRMEPPDWTVSMVLQINPPFAIDVSTFARLRCKLHKKWARPAEWGCHHNYFPTPPFPSSWGHLLQLCFPSSLRNLCLSREVSSSNFKAATPKRSVDISLIFVARRLGSKCQKQIGRGTRTAISILMDLEFHGILWNIMEYHGIICLSMCIYVYLCLFPISSLYIYSIYI